MRTAWDRMRTAEVAAAVSTALGRRGIRATLVGGACVAIYSGEKYVSEDLDFVTDAPLEEVERALGGLGFKRSGRMFFHPRCRAFWLDFPAPPLSIGGAPVRTSATLRIGRGTVRLLTPTDCVCDRLAAYYHWDDPQGLEQALLVAGGHSVNMRRVRSWSRAEKNLDKFRVFEARLRRPAAARGRK